MQQTGGCHTCMRPVTCGDPGDGPKADRVSWPIASIPDVGDGVSWRSADFSAQSRGAPRWVAGSPGVWLSVTPCPAIIARPGWPAVVTPPSAPRSLMGRGQVQAYGTCPLQNEHESAPDLVRRIRQSGPPPRSAGGGAPPPLDETHVAHWSQCVKLLHVGSRRRQSPAAARRQAFDAGSTAIPTWLRSAPPPALPARCSACSTVARTPRHRRCGSASWCVRRRRARGRRHAQRGLGLAPRG